MTNAEIANSPITLFPSSLYLENYKLVFSSIPIGRGFVNSILVSVITTFFVLFTSSLAGYMFAKLKFKGINNLFILVLSSLFFPSHILT